MMSLIRSNLSCINFNNEVLKQLYSYLNNVKCYNGMYYIIFKMTNSPTDYFKEAEHNIEELLELYDGNIDAVKNYLESIGCHLLCITSESLSNWKGLRKERDSKLKEAISSPKAIIIAQNKVIETLLIPKISKLDICPLCKSKITEEHLSQIREEINPKLSSLKEDIQKADKELTEIQKNREILNN